MSEESSQVPGGTRRLRRSGSFLISDEPGLPRQMEVDGRRWYRFMDRIYCPAPVAQLSTELVTELCGLRLDLDDEVIVASVHQAVTRAVVAVAASVRPAAATVLDFGTGDGRNLPVIGSAFDRAVVLGCDMSPRALSSASWRGSVVRTSPTGPLPFEDGSLDLVLCLFVLHFAVPLSVLRDLRRSLCSDGRLVGNLYGPAVSEHRARMSRAGFEAVTSVLVPGASGHSVIG